MVNQILIQAHGLENLRPPVTLHRGNAHLGHYLEQTLFVGLDIVFPGGIGIRPVQLAAFRQILYRIQSQIGVDRPGSVAQQQAEVMHFPGFPRFHDQAHFRAAALPNQVMMDGGGSQQAGNGRLFPIHPPVGQDDYGIALGNGLGRRGAQVIQSRFQGIRPLGVKKDGQGNGAHFPGIQLADLRQFPAGQQGGMEFQLAAVFRRFGEKIPLPADKGFEGSYQFLPNGVERRIGYLGKQLLEIVEQQLILFRQHRQRRIVAHRPYRLIAAGRHGRGQHPQFLVGIAKGPLPPGQFRPVGPGRRRGRRQGGQSHLVVPQPLAVGLAAGQVLFQFRIADNAPLLQADQKHPPRLKPAALLDLRRRNIQYPRFRGHHQLVILGNGVAEGAQAVAIQHGADVAVRGGHHHRRPVPRLHQAGMIFVKIPLFRRHIRMLFPRLGNHHQHRMVQAAAGHGQQFQGIVKAGRVAGPRRHHRGNLGNVRPEPGRGELRFPGVHPVDIAA